MSVVKLTEITWEEFLGLFHESVHHALKAHYGREDVTHMVVFENLDISSTLFGKRSAMPVGPGCSYKTLDSVREGRLGDTPSRFQYPVHYTTKPVKAAS